MKQIFILCFLLLSIFSFSQEEISIKSNVSPKLITTQDVVTLVITTNQRAEIDLEPLKKDFQTSRPRTLVYSNIYSIYENGQSKQIVDQGFRTTILLSPKHAGSIKIPALNITIENKIYQSDEDEITVRQADEQKIYFGEISFTIPKTTYYVGEEIVGELNILVPAFSKDFALNSTKSSKFAVELIKHPRLSGLNNRHLTFKFNNVYAPFQRAQVTETQYNQRAFINFSIFTSIIAKDIGEITLPQFSFNYETIPTPTPNDHQNVLLDDPRWQEKNLINESKKITILDLPTKDKPTNFTGIIGAKPTNFTASCKETEVQVGDPILVKLTLNGKYSKTSLFNIDWKQQENLAKSFKFPTQKILPIIGEADTTTWEIIIRPENENLKEIPPFIFHYFDSYKGCYKSVQTQAIPLKVKTTQTITSPLLKNSLNQSKENEILKETSTPMALNFNKQELLKKPESFLNIINSQKSWFIIPFLLFIIYLLILIIPKIHFSQIKKEKKDYKKITNTLEKILKETSNFSTIQNAFLNYLAEYLDINSKAVTYSDAKKIADLPETLLLFNEFDQVTYSGKTSINIEQIKQYILIITKYIGK